MGTFLRWRGNQASEQLSLFSSPLLGLIFACAGKGPPESTKNKSTRPFDARALVPVVGTTL
jgi:hypothetical protein